MHLVLSCCGEGFGHASRLIALAQRLKERHRVICFCPPSVSGYIRKTIPDIDIIHIPVLSFAKKRGRIRYLKTIGLNTMTVLQMPVIINRLSDMLKEMAVDAAITDFDPFTSLAARKCGIPNLEINHPGIVLKYFAVSPGALVAKLVALFMESVYTKKINCSFYDGSVGPIIRDEVISARKTTEDFFLVYFTGMDKKKVVELLAPFKKVHFKIFPDPDQNFVASLASCRGVITTAGHQMISEALYLEKPLLVFPQKGQYEQRLNARMLERSGWGLQGSLKKLHESISVFMNKAESFPLTCHPSKKHLFIRDDNREQVLSIVEEFFVQTRDVRRKNKQRIPKKRPLEVLS